MMARIMDFGRLKVNRMPAGLKDSHYGLWGPFSTDLEGNDNTCAQEREEEALRFPD
jgi:hypothetical protein